MLLRCEYRRRFMETLVINQSGLVLLAATCICQINFRNGYVGLLILYLLPLLNPWLTVEMQPDQSFLQVLLSKMLVALCHSHGRSTRYFNRLHDFSVTIYEGVTIHNKFFPHTARLCNSLPVECVPLTYDLNGFRCGVNRYLFIWLSETPIKKISTKIFYQL